MADLKSNIPTEFYNTEKAKCLHPPRVNTVGELIEQLERLPKSLLLSGWPDAHTHEIVVYNVNMDNTHLTVEEVDL